MTPRDVYALLTAINALRLELRANTEMRRFQPGDSEQWREIHHLYDCADQSIAAAFDGSEIARMEADA